MEIYPRTRLNNFNLKRIFHKSAFPLLSVQSHVNEPSFTKHTISILLPAGSSWELYKMYKPLTNVPLTKQIVFLPRPRLCPRWRMNFLPTAFSVPWGMWSCDARGRAVICQSPLELHALAYSHQHITFWPFSSLMSCLALKVLLIGQGHAGWIGRRLAAPGHHWQHVGVPSSYERRGLWVLSSLCSHLLRSPAPVNCSWHVRHHGGFHRDDRCANWDGACAPNWGGTSSRRLWGGGAAYCGNPRGDDNWPVACRIGASAGSGVEAMSGGCKDVKI